MKKKDNKTSPESVNEAPKKQKSSQHQNINKFIKDATEKMGGVYDDDMQNKILSKFNNDYDKIIDYVAENTNIKDKEAFRPAIYEKYGLVKADKKPALLPTPTNLILGKEPTEQKPVVVEEEDTTYIGDIGRSVAKGITTVSQGIVRLPSTIYRIAALPQNLLSNIPGLEGLEISKDTNSSVLNFLDDNKITQYYDEDVKRRGEKLKQYSQSATEQWNNGDKIGALKTIGVQAAESIPLTALLFASGGAGAIKEAAVGIGTYATGQKLHQLDESNPDMSEVVKVTNSILTGAAEAGSESMSMGTIGIGKKLLAREGAEGLRKIIQTSFMSNMGTKIGSIYNVASPMVGEGLTEAAAKYSENYIDLVTGATEDTNMMKGVFDNFLVGTVAGGVISAPISTYNEVVTQPVFRQKLKADFKKAEVELNDLAHTDYAQGIQEIVNNHEDVNKTLQHFMDINEYFDVNIEERLIGRNYIVNSINMYNTNDARKRSIQAKIANNIGKDGQVTMTMIDGKPYSVRNTQDLGKEGKVIFVKDNDGNIKTVISSKITEWESKLPTQLEQEQMDQEDMADLMASQEQTMQDEAISKGLVEGKTVETPLGKKTLVTVNTDGTSTVTNNKGEKEIVNTDEIQAYKTAEQKEAERVEAEANQSLMEGIEEGATIISDEPLTDQSETRVITFDNKQGKIITPEGEQVFDNEEDLNSAISEFATAELDVAEQEDIDNMSPEQAYESMIESDPENIDIANEIFNDKISDVRTRAEDLRSQAKESKSTKEKKDLLIQAKQLEADAIRLEVVFQAEQLNQEYQQEKDNTPYNQLMPWEQEILGRSISLSSFIENSDKANITKQLGKAWLRKNGQTLDTLSKEVSEQTGQTITVQDIVEFMIENPSAHVRKTTNRMNELQGEYKDLTGKSIKKYEAPEEVNTKPDHIADVEDSPFGEVPKDIPFRATEEAIEKEDAVSVNVSEKAQEELKSRQNATKAIEKLSQEINYPINIVSSEEIERDTSDIIYDDNGNILSYAIDGKVYLVSTNISSVSKAKSSIINQIIKQNGVGELTIKNNYAQKYRRLINRHKSRTGQDNLSIDSFLKNANKSEIKDFLNIIRKGYALTSNQYNESDLRSINKEFDPQELFSSIKAPNASDVIVVSTQEELPKSIINHKIFSWDIFDAAFVGDKIYVNSKAVKDQAEAIRLWIHENGIHNGIRVLIPDASDREALFENVYNSALQLSDASPEILYAINRVTKGVYSKQSKAEQGEEILAFYAEKIVTKEHLTPAEKTLWNKLTEHIRTLLSNLYKFDVKALTETDIANIIYSSVKSNFNESRDSNQGADSGIRQRKQSKTPDFTGNQSRNVQRQELPSTDEVKDSGRQTARSDSEVKFRAEPVKGNENLVVLHNISGENIMNIDKIGGLPVPSLAVARTDIPFTSFGEISLIADKSIIDPKGRGNSRIFNADIYSPRYPSITYDLNWKKFEEIFKGANKLSDKYGFHPISIGSLDLEHTGLNKLNENNITRLAFLSEIGKVPRPKNKDTALDKSLHKFVGRYDHTNLYINDPKFVEAVTEMYKKIDAKLGKDHFVTDGIVNENLLNRQAILARTTTSLRGPDSYANRDNIRDKINNSPSLKKQYTAWISDKFNSIVEKEKIFTGYTNDGSIKYIPHTLNNVVKELTKGLQGAEGMFYGVGSVRSGAAKEFKSIEDIQSDRDNIVSDKDFEQHKERSSERFEEILELVKPYYKYDTEGFNYSSNAGESLLQYAKKGRSSDFKSFPKDVKKEVGDFLTLLKYMPSAYFEAKVQRVVALNEFKAAVVPRNTSKEVIDVLEKNGIKIKKYNPKTEGDRTKKVELTSRQEGVKFRTSEGESFEKWKGNNELLTGYEVPNAKTGEPIVVRAYHGTTHPFDVFKGGEKGNIEGHLGKTNYFTSDEADAEGNYGATGKDLTNRIEQRKDALQSYVEEYAQDDTIDFESISEEFNIPVSEIEGFDTVDDISNAIAENELKGGEEQVLDLYLKLNNPLVLGESPVYVETIDKSAIYDYMDDAADEIADEYGIDLDEAKEDYQLEIEQRAAENSGTENKLIEALRLSLEGNEHYEDPSQFLSEAAYESEVDLNTLDESLRASLNEAYLENEEGQITSSQIMSDFYEELGYDGVILTDVAKRFPNMGLSEKTSHIHIPDQYNNQIKLADGSNVEFGETNDIRFRVSGSKQELEDFVKDNKVKETIYPGTDVKFRMVAESPDFSVEHERYNGASFEIKGDKIYTTLYQTRYEEPDSSEHLSSDINVEDAISESESTNEGQDYDYTGASIAIIADHLEIPISEIKDDMGWEKDEYFNPIEEISNSDITDFLEDKDVYDYSLDNDYYTTHTSEDPNDNTDQLLYDVQAKLSKDFGFKIGKYSNIYFDKDNNITNDSSNENREVSIRIADHTHNPRNGHNDVTVVIANKNATKDRFFTANTDLVFTDANSSAEIAAEIKQYIENKFEYEDETKFRVDNPKDKPIIVANINKKHGWNYKIAGNGRIYEEFMDRKQWITIDELMASSRELSSNAIISENSKKVSEYLGKSGFKKQYVNKDGSSVYWNDGKITVRVSDHENQSIYHDNASINVFSEKKDGYKGIITSIKQLKESDKVNPDPSEAQKEAGNYAMGHIQFDGFDVSIENPKGSIRSGVNQEGEKWSNIMPANYGYFKGTIGNDKDHIDTFMGDNMESDKVYVVDQVDPITGKFDEHKVMMGYNSLSEARNAYNEAYDEGWAGLGAITRTTKDGLKEWFNGDTKKPFADVSKIKYTIFKDEDGEWAISYPDGGVAILTYPTKEKAEKAADKLPLSKRHFWKRGMEDIRFRVTSSDPNIQKLLDKLQAVQDLSKTIESVKGLEAEAKQTLPLERQSILTRIEGIKEGAKIGAKDTKELIKAVQKEITDYAKKSIPLAEAGARDLKSLLTLVKESQTPASIEKAFERIDELTGQNVDKIERKKHVSKVKRLLKWMTGLKKSGTKLVGKFNYTDSKRFQELKEINDKAIALTKKSNSWKATAEEKMEAEKGLDQMFEDLETKENRTSLDDVMMKLIELIRLGSKATPRLAQIVSEDLEAIYSLAKEAKSEADMETAIQRKEDKEFIKSFLRDDSIKKKSWYKRAIRNINSKTADIMGNWETLMTMIGGNENRDKRSFLIEESQIAVGKQESSNKLLDKAKEIYGSNSKTSTLNKIHSLAKKEYELRRPNEFGKKGEGDAFEISKLDLMDIFNAIQNERIRDDYYMSYGDIILDENGNRDTDAQYMDGKKRIDALLSNLQNEDIELAKTMKDIISSYRAAMNDIHIKLYNRDMQDVGEYWPSTAQRQKDIDPMAQMSADYRYASSLQSRMEHRTPVPTDAFNKFTKHIEEAEWMINMAIPFKQSHDIFKDNQVRALLDSARGEKFTKLVDDSLINTTLNSPAKMQQKSELHTLLNPILNNWVTSKIGLTPTVPVKQLLSAVNYAENMPAEQWVTGLVKGLISPKDTWRQMMEIPYLKSRLGNGYSEAIQRALNGDDNVHQSQATNYHQAFKNLMTIGTRYGDITAIVFGGKPYLDYMIKEGMKKEGAIKEEVEREAVDKFLQDTLRSQQSPFTSSLSKLQNSKNPFFRAVFAFANTPSQYMRKLFEANQNYRVQQDQFKTGKINKEEFNNVKKQTAKVHAIYGLINTVSFTAMGALMQSLMRGADFDDDLLKDMVVQLEQTFIGGLPIIKDIVSAMTKATLGLKVYDDSKPFIEGIDQMADAGIKLLTGNAKYPGKEYEKIAQGLATMVGVPYYNIKKTIKSIPPFREETLKETRVKEVGYKLTDMKKDDDVRIADAAKSLSTSYRRAKRKAKKLKSEGKLLDSNRITKLIEKSKIHLWKSDYSTSDLNMELKQFDKMVDIIIFS